MPSPLHPKSIQTTSLFGATLLLSFVVVGMPHLLPCPVDRRQFAQGHMEGLDGEGRRVRRRRVLDTEPAGAEEDTTEEHVTPQSRKKSRECPVPKPGGLMGQVLGFKPEQSPSKPSVRIEGRTAKDAGE